LAAPATKARGLGRRLRSGADNGERSHHTDSEGRENGREEGEGERAVRPDAKRHQDAEHRDRHEVHAALDEEERNRAASDPTAWHTATMENPCAQRQATCAAGGNNRTHGEFRPPDLPYATP